MLQVFLIVIFLPPAGVSLAPFLLLSSLIAIRGLIALPSKDLAILLGVLSVSSLAVAAIRHPEFSLSAPFPSAGLIILTVWIGFIYRWCLDKRVSDAEAIRRVNMVTSELVDANVALQDLTDQTNDQAARRERLALSRELHDTVAYTFTTIAASIELAAELIDRDREAVLGELRHARNLTAEGLREVRGIVRTTREEAERGFRGLGRWGALVDVFKQATGVIVTLDAAEHFPELIEELDNLVYHLIQEGMINAYRHGHATVIWVKVWIERAHLCVTVSDNGCGTDQLGSGFGIMGMQERVHALGGRISWLTAPGAGFDLAVEIPLEEKEPSP